jgi:hypothetical protein
MKGVVMRTISFTRSFVRSFIAFVVMFVAIVIVSGCAHEQPPIAGDATTRPAVRETPLAQTSGAQLWSENCMRCHNLRSPETYSSTQWELAMHHMRLRANLTGEETEKITTFLKSAN